MKAATNEKMREEVQKINIICKRKACPYCDKIQNFCLRRIVSIDENGMCGVIWWKGALKPPLTKDLLESMNQITVVQDLQPPQRDEEKDENKDE